MITSPVRTSSSVTIEALALDQLPRVEAVARRIWPECFASFLSAEQIDAIVDALYSHAALRVAACQHGHTFWIARVLATDAGYAAAYVQGATLWIKKLYVKKLWLGHGLGQALMTEAVAAFPEATTTSLLVNERTTQPAPSTVDWDSSSAIACRSEWGPNACTTM